MTVVVLTFAITALVLALACFAYAGWVSLTGHDSLLRMQRPGARLPPSPFPGSRVAGRAVLLALLLLLLGAAITLVDRTVAPWNAQPSSALSPVNDDGDYFAAHMASFRGPASLHAGTLSRPLCLARFYDRARTRQRGGDPGANWWTTCRYRARLATVAQVRERLALPHAWGARNGLVIAEVPAGASVTYLAGVASRQCEPHGGRCYPGGGRQVLFRDEDFERAWFSRYECSQTAETAPARFVACAG